MRIALVSDIHGNLAALEAVAADIRRRGADTVVNLGDNLSGPLLPLETADFLMASGWLSLAGNHERQLLSVADGVLPGASDEYAYSQLSERELRWLRTLKPFAQFDDEVFLCHATPRSDCEYFLETVDGAAMRLASPAEIAERLNGESSRVVACGHTHVPRSLRLASGQLLVNPGSVGLQAYDDDQPHFHVMEMGSTDARYAMLEKDRNGWATALIAVPYDYRSMAALARQRERPDWEHALLSGYVQHKAQQER
jgi:predicted phosphodiesterase